MRIVNAVFSKQNGGLERASLDYAKALRALGHDVTMLVNHRCRFLDAAQAGGPLRMERNRFGKWDMFASIRLRRWLMQEKPDVILAHGNRAISLLRRAARGIVPLIAVNHTISVRNSLHADAVITVNEDQKQELLALGHKQPDAIHVVPNMVTLTPEQRALRISHAPQSPPVIGVLARLVHVKAVDVFLDAIGLLRERGVDIRARIGGDGPDRPELQARADRLGISDRVEFLGWVEEPHRFYDMLDIYCLPSRRETFGIVVLEALQHKLPVIATNCMGVRQLADGRNVALLVPQDDAGALADAIARLLEDWPLAQRLAASGYALVEEKYDIQIVARQLQKIITHVVHNQQGADA